MAFLLPRERKRREIWTETMEKKVGQVNEWSSFFSFLERERNLDGNYGKVNGL